MNKKGRRKLLEMSTHPHVREEMQLSAVSSIAMYSEEQIQGLYKLIYDLTKEEYCLDISTHAHCHKDLSLKEVKTIINQMLAGEDSLYAAKYAKRLVDLNLDAAFVREVLDEKNKNALEHQLDAFFPDEERVKILQNIAVSKELNSNTYQNPNLKLPTPGLSMDMTLLEIGGFITILTLAYAFVKPVRNMVNNTASILAAPVVLFSKSMFPLFAATANTKPVVKDDLEAGNINTPKCK